MWKSVIAHGLLAARAVFFVVLFPGTVAAYLPYRFLAAAGQLSPPAVTLRSVAAALLVVLGAAVLLSSVWQFAVAGRGTLAPVDPPRDLVVSGLYRFTRNPMYNGVVAVLLGEAWLFWSLRLLVYAAVVFVAFHLFVVLYEERALTARFGEPYHRYRVAVPRWGFTLRPYPPGARKSHRDPGETGSVASQGKEQTPDH